MAVTTKAVELRIEGVQTVAELGGRKPRPGYEFLIVDTSWKNVIPLRAVAPAASSSSGGGLGAMARTPGAPPPDPNAGPQSTPYVVPGLPDFFWIFSDNRYADTVDVQLQNSAPNHLNNGFGVAQFGEVLRGTIAFEVPANARFRAFQFFDVTNGNAYIPLGGAKPANPPASGPVRENAVVQVAVGEAGFGPAGRQAPPGLRYYTVSLRGQSKSPKDVIRIPLQLMYAQNDRGCISTAESDMANLARPFERGAQFVPGAPNEGDIAFLVPDDTKDVRLIIASAQPGVGPLVLPSRQDFTPTWPSPQASLTDGTTMKVHVLPAPKRPAGLPGAAAGRELVVLDIVLENLTQTQGIDFQTSQQLRLMDGRNFIEPMPLSHQLPCRLGESGVIPPGTARRLTLVYDVPAGLALKLQYRGFEQDEATLDIKR